MHAHDRDPVADGDGSAGRHASIWTETTDSNYDPLDGDREVDTVVVGGGIVGVTTAAELAAADRSVALVERDHIAAGTTGHSTAKLTSQHGIIYDHLLDRFGEDRARQYATANESAIDRVEEHIERYDIDCEFARLPSYLFSESAEYREKLRDEAAAARRAGIDAAVVDDPPTPFEVTGAVRFDDQAYFHPRSYLLGLAEAVTEMGGEVYEETTAEELQTGRRHRLVTDHGTITAANVVQATQFPVFDRGLYFTRLTPKRSYVLAVRLASDVPEELYYRPTDPYFSVRPHPAGDESLALIAGENHRTGEGGNTEGHYRRLEQAARSRYDVEAVEYRWSTQDFVSVDHVPMIGRATPGSDGIYVATGFGGWGLTTGTSAGVLLSNHIRGRDTPWADVYRPTRFTPIASAKHFLSHNTKAATHFVRDRLSTAGGGREADLAPGEGRVVRRDGDPVAAYRDDDGTVHAVSAVCTHLDCLVKWNDAERSWDCPCHGSRFAADGEVLNGPAVEDLPKREL